MITYYIACKECQTEALANVFPKKKGYQVTYCPNCGAALWKKRIAKTSGYETMMLGTIEMITKHLGIKSLDDVPDDIKDWGK